MSALLAEKHNEIQERRRALDAKMEPLRQEEAKLAQAAAELQRICAGEVSDAGAGTTMHAPAAPQPARRAVRRAPGRPAGRRRGRPKGSGKRYDQAVRVVSANPGIKIPHIAEAMGIKPNYLYRVMPELEKAGRVKKRGRGWEAVK